MKKIELYESLTGKAARVWICHNVCFVLDGYGYGIESANNTRCNRVMFYDGKFAVDYVVNARIRHFLHKQAIDDTLTDAMGSAIVNN